MSSDNQVLQRSLLAASQPIPLQVYDTHGPDTKSLDCSGPCQRIGDVGNTVIVIEHNLDVMKSADYIIDLGPEGGADGGKVVATGTPEEIVRVKKSYTGQALKAVLN